MRQDDGGHVIRVRIRDARSIGTSAGSTRGGQAWLIRHECRRIGIWQRLPRFADLGCPLDGQPDHLLFRVGSDSGRQPAATATPGLATSKKPFVRRRSSSRMSATSIFKKSAAWREADIAWWLVPYNYLGGSVGSHDVPDGHLGRRLWLLQCPGHHLDRKQPAPGWLRLRHDPA